MAEAAAVTDFDAEPVVAATATASARPAAIPGLPESNGSLVAAGDGATLRPGVPDRSRRTNANAAHICGEDPGVYPFPPPNWPPNPNHDTRFAPKPNAASGTGSDVGVTAEVDVSEEADCAGDASGTPDNAVTVDVFSGVGSASNGIPTEGASAPPSAIARPDGGATSTVDTDAAAGGDL
jgi:hypothetical protein